ncbi:hypothetical protein GCM10011363_45700 [Marivita lacus]|uniref:Uncharacterized protein n=1 Tax=Marivita lacus TaxID=1323742 RepID=A0ABQ1LKP9_9RHOB|nr:hypothetical protein GCM10011363_45700 [Marivita lacus]
MSYKPLRDFLFENLLSEDRREKGFIMQRLALVFCVVLCAATGPLLALGSSLARDSDRLVLVVSTPFGPTVGQIIERSALVEVYPVRAPFGAFVILSDPADAAILRAAGAVILLSGERIIALCS